MDHLHPLPQSVTPFEGGLHVRGTIGKTAARRSALQPGFPIERSHSQPEMFCEDKSYINGGVIGVEVINQPWFRSS